jgi:hypothetical protein
VIVRSARLPEHPAGNLKGKIARDGEFGSGLDPIGSVIFEHLEDDGAKMSSESTDGLIVPFALGPLFLVVSL